MFTTGIFTTHLPYLVFGIFYGFFFLIGIQKGSDEKLVVNSINDQIQFSGFTDLNPDFYKKQPDTSGFHFSPNLEKQLKIQVFQSKNSIIIFPANQKPKPDFNLTGYSRPPPAC